MEWRKMERVNLLGSKNELNEIKRKYLIGMLGLFGGQMADGTTK